MQVLKMIKSLMDPLSSTEEIINEARNGRMCLLVDDPDRENEGDLIIPAQKITPEGINFMSKYGKNPPYLKLRHFFLSRYF